MICLRREPANSLLRFRAVGRLIVSSLPDPLRLWMLLVQLRMPEVSPSLHARTLIREYRSNFTARNFPVEKFLIARPSPRHPPERRVISGAMCCVDLEPGKETSGSSVNSN